LTAGVILVLLRFEKGVVHAKVPCHTRVSLASMGRWRLEPWCGVLGNCRRNEISVADVAGLNYSW